MEEQRILLDIILIIIMIFSLSFLVAAETALSSLKRAHIGEIKETDSKEKKLLKLWLKNPNELLATLLFGKTLIYLSLTWNLLNFFEKYEMILKRENIQIYKILYFLICVVCILIFSEIIPRVYAKSNIYQISKKLIVPLNTVRIILKPFILVFINFSKLILKLFKVKLEEQMFEITEEDIKTYVKVGTESGTIEEGEEEMIHSIFEFSDTTVREILTPRTAIFALDMEKTLEEVWDEILEQGFSRIPIFNETIDNIVGIAHIKDIMKYEDKEYKNIQIKEIMKEAYFVPETKNLVELLEEFKAKKTHMAIIIDEYGGTLGLITIEDLLEEIVGEIQDEFDHEEEMIQQVNEKIYDIKGDSIIEELNDELSIKIPTSEEYETVAGYIQYELGKVAEISDQVLGDGFVLKVLEIDNKRIEKVRVIMTENLDEEKNDKGNS